VKRFGTIAFSAKALSQGGAWYETGILRKLTSEIWFNFWPCVFLNGATQFNVRVAGVVPCAPSAEVELVHPPEQFCSVSAGGKFNKST
jgi:hypothetical protein